MSTSSGETCRSQALVGFGELSGRWNPGRLRVGIRYQSLPRLVPLGVAARLGWSDVPEVFGWADAMIIAGFLFAIEFVTDKVPFDDTFWDAASSISRACHP